MSLTRRFQRDWRQSDESRAAEIDVGPQTKAAIEWAKSVVGVRPLSLTTEWGSLLPMAHEDQPQESSSQPDASEAPVKGDVDTTMALLLEAHLRDQLEDLASTGAHPDRLAALGEAHSEVMRILRVGLKIAVPEEEWQKFGLDLV